MQQGTHPRIPVSTYRVQLNRTCTFRDVATLIPYLHDLGITDLYCSPYFKAVPGSMHGYDVVDPNTLNPEIGTEEDYRAMIDELHRRGMGQLLDVVPNHMGITLQLNGWWQDVLENGPSASYAAFFDIDWDPLKPELRNKVLLPILGGQYGVVLENQELRLIYENGRFLVRYYDHILPVAPKPSALILAHRLDTLIAETGVDSTHIMELESIITALRHLPARQDRAPALVAERSREKEVIKRRLALLVEGSAAIRAFLDENVRLINGVQGDPRSFDLLDQILSDQAYRLAYWRVAAEEVNYRRFFDINELAALRMENEGVFEATHRYVLELAASGRVAGLRIDHPDGLYDPAAYFGQVQEGYARRAGLACEASDRPVYLVVEKIIAPHEDLPEAWPVHGTTGYRYANTVNGVLVDTESRARIDRTWRAFAGTEATDFELAAYQGRRAMLRGPLAAGLTVLASQALHLARSDRRTRDHTLASLRQGLLSSDAGNASKVDVQAWGKRKRDKGSSLRIT